MGFEVLGIQEISYVNKAGKPVNGVNLHVSFEQKNVNGVAVDKLYISKAKYQDMPMVQVGDNIKVMYNRWGSVESIDLI